MSFIYFQLPTLTFLYYFLNIFILTKIQRKKYFTYTKNVNFNSLYPLLSMLYIMYFIPYPAYLVFCKPYPTYIYYKF